MTGAIRVQAKLHFRRGPAGRKVAEAGAAPPVPTTEGRVPRIARLLALAHRFDALIAEGKVRDYADLARLGHVTRARVTQITNMLGLAPDMQEEILCSSPTVAGDDWVTERQIRQVAAELDWVRQRVLWKEFTTG